MDEDPERRERVRALLAEQHTFPGSYLFRVVVKPADRPQIIGAVSATVGDDRIEDVGEKSSREGTYVSLRIRILAESPEMVLDVYDTIRAIEGVFAVM